MDIALQLYTARTLAAEDMPGLIQRLAGLGYDKVELAGYGNVTARELRDAATAAGVEVVAAHVPYDRFANEIDTVLAEMALLGCRHAIVPWLHPDLRNEAGTAQLIGNLNAWGARCRDEGIRIGYHNHEFEFEPMNGSTMFERIRTGTDPDLVSLEIDLCWAAYGGADTVELIEQNAGRVPLLHAKDLTADGQMTTVGEGALPWNEIIPAARAAGTTCLVIEHDDPADPMQVARQGLTNLKRLLEQNPA